MCFVSGHVHYMCTVHGSVLEQLSPRVVARAHGIERNGAEPERQRGEAQVQSAQTKSRARAHAARGGIRSATAERDATKSLWEGINDVKEQLLVPALRLPLDDKVTASELREKHMRSPKEFFQENMKGWKVR